MVEAIKDDKWKICPVTGTYFTWENFWYRCKVKHDPWRRPLPKNMKSSWSKGSPWESASCDGTTCTTKINGTKVELSIGKL